MSKQSTHLLFWGSGKMAAALAQGLRAGANECLLSFYSPSGVSAHALAREVQGQVFEADKHTNIDYLVLAHKPQQLKEALPELLKVLKGKRTVIISLLAGVRLATLKVALPGHEIVRLMPNTPITVGEGLLGWYFETTSVLQAPILELFKNCGHSLVLASEDHFDSYAALAGSGPAYLFELARIFEAQAIRLGLGKGDAEVIVKKLFLGSAKLMEQSSESFEALRNAVTSKGGVTAEALRVFCEHNLEGTVKVALDKNIARSQELAQASSK